MVDNVYDVFLASDERTTRVSFGVGLAEAPGFEYDQTAVGFRAEHCGHAGAVNIARHAQRLTGVAQVAALLGGLHLGGPAFEPSSGQPSKR